MMMMTRTKASYTAALLHDGGTDEFGVVEAVGVMYVFRQVFLHVLHSLVHGIGYLDVVGARLRNYYDA